MIAEYKYIIVPIFTWLFIQTFKFILDFIVNKKINFKRIVGAGGMPSSHSAIVMVITTMVGKNEGVTSSIFAITLIAIILILIVDLISVLIKKKVSKDV